MNHLRSVGRNLRPGASGPSFSSPHPSLDYWARRGSHLPYYYDHLTPPQGYSFQPSPYPYTPLQPSPYTYYPHPTPHLYPQNFYPFRHQHPQLFSYYSNPGQLPVVNRGTRVSTRSNTETPQTSPVPDVHLHPELWWNCNWSEFSRGIIWDVALPPSDAARLSTPRLNIAHPDSEAFAITTQRRIDRIELWSDHPHLAHYMRAWGPISVSETSTPTILQLLRAIYDYLNTPLTNEDYWSICSNPHNLERLNVSRESRIQDGFDAVYLRGPFRRSDVIGGHRRFLGIRVVNLRDGVLTLHFNLGPGPVPLFYE